MKSEINGTKLKVKKNLESTAMRVDTEIKVMLEKEVEKLKKLKKGSGKVRICHILKKVIPLLTDKHREELIAATVTGEDRQKVAFSNYSKKHKGISKNDFLDLTLYGEININDYLPAEMRRSINHPKSNKLEIA